MADLTATLGVNYEKTAISQSDAGREIVVKIAKTDITDAEMATITKAITLGGTNSDDAATIAAVGTADGSAFVSGTTDVVFLRVQTTGQLTAIGSNAYGVTGAVTTLEAVFAPAK